MFVPSGDGASHLFERHGIGEWEEDLDEKQDRLIEFRNYNLHAKVGTKVRCPVCRGRFKKRSHQHVFCRNKGHANCKDRFHNLVNPERLERVGIHV